MKKVAPKTKCPQNRIAVINLINKILTYSAIKIKANTVPLYSTLKPDTNSDSPSAKSKGARLVSAKVVINQIINKGDKKIKNGVGVWGKANSSKFNEAAKIVGIKIISAMDTS